MQKIEILTCYNTIATNNNKVIMLQLQETIDTKLTKLFGDKYNDFKRVMEQTRARICGSFIISCILPTFKNNDVDISVDNVEEYNQLVNFMRTVTENNSQNSSCNYRNFMLQSQVAIIMSTYVEIVLKRKDNPITYDLDICNNSITFNNNGMEINCLYDKIKNSTATLVNNIMEGNKKGYIKFMYRLTKYSDRGINIEYPLPVVSYIETILQDKSSTGRVLTIDMVTYSDKICDKLEEIHRTKSNVDYSRIKSIKVDDRSRKIYEQSRFYKCGEGTCYVKLFFKDHKHYHYHCSHYNAVVLRNDNDILGGLDRKHFLTEQRLNQLLS